MDEATGNGLFGQSFFGVSFNFVTEFSLLPRRTVTNGETKLGKFLGVRCKMFELFMIEWSMMTGPNFRLLFGRKTLLELLAASF